VGDGASTEIAVEHKLGTKHVVTNVYEKEAPFAEVIPTVQITDENHVTLIFLTAPSLDQYVVVVVSGGGGGGGGGSEANGYVPTHKWLMQETTGTEIKDSVGAENLTITGGFTLNASQLPGFAATDTHAIGFDESGTGEMLSAADAPMPTFGFMVSFWWRPIASPSFNGVIFVYGTTSTGFALQHLAGGGLTSIMDAASTGVVGSVSSDGTWRRMALWIPESGEARQAKLFIDGVLIGTTESHKLTAGEKDQLVLGSYFGSSNFVNETEFSRLSIVPCTTAYDAVFIAATDYAGQIGVIPN
jgi:hypothetical protein